MKTFVTILFASLLASTGSIPPSLRCSIDEGCDAKHVTPVRIIGTDERIVLEADYEKAHFTGVGYFSTKVNAVQGTGFLIESRTLVLTSAHVFTHDGRMNVLVFPDSGRSLNLSLFKFSIPECKRSYAIKRFEMPPKIPHSDEHFRDVALIWLAEPACNQAKPFLLEAADDEELLDDLQKARRGIQVVGVYDFNRDEKPEKQVGPPAPRRLISNCFVKGTTQALPGTMLEHDCDTMPGGSGGPIVTSILGEPRPIAIHKGSSPEPDELNRGIFFSGTLVKWIKDQSR